jgi:hypothetical protein
MKDKTPKYEISDKICCYNKNEDGKRESGIIKGIFPDKNDFLYRVNSTINSSIDFYIHEKDVLTHTPSVSKPLDWSFLKDKTKKELKQRWDVIQEQERTWIQKGRPKTNESDYFFEDNYREILKEMIARKMPKFDVGDTVKLTTYPELDADKITAIVNYNEGEFFYHLQNNEMGFNGKNSGIREKALEKTTPVVFKMNQYGVFTEYKKVLDIANKYGLKSASIKVAAHNDLWYYGVAYDFGDEGYLTPCSIGTTGYANKNAALVASTREFWRIRNNPKVKKSFWDLWIFEMAKAVMQEELEIELAKLQMENA